MTITSAPASPDNDRSPSWAFTTEAGATTKCQLIGPSGVVSAFSACTAPKTYDRSYDVAEDARQLALLGADPRCKPR